MVIALRIFIETYSSNAADLPLAITPSKYTQSWWLLRRLSLATVGRALSFGGKSCPTSFGLGRAKERPSFEVVAGTPGEDLLIGEPTQ
jgi:hypothetical protein